MLKFKQIKKEDILENPKKYLDLEMIAVLKDGMIVMGHLASSDFLTLHYYFEIISEKYLDCCSPYEINEYYIIETTDGKSK